MDLMEMLRSLFGDEPLTFDQFAEKLNAATDLKLGNLAGGQYVDKNKFEDVNNQLATANTQLQEANDISTRTPHARCDILSALLFLYLEISTHTPHARCDT